MRRRLYDRQPERAALDGEEQELISLRAGRDARGLPAALEGIDVLRLGEVEPEPPFGLRARNAVNSPAPAREAARVEPFALVAYVEDEVHAPVRAQGAARTAAQAAVGAYACGRAAGIGAVIYLQRQALGHGQGKELGELGVVRQVHEVEAAGGGEIEGQDVRAVRDAQLKAALAARGPFVHGAVDEVRAASGDVGARFVVGIARAQYVRGQD